MQDEKVVSDSHGKIDIESRVRKWREKIEQRNKDCEGKNWSERVERESGEIQQNGKQSAKIKRT